MKKTKIELMHSVKPGCLVFDAYWAVLRLMSKGGIN